MHVSPRGTGRVLSFPQGPGALKPGPEPPGAQQGRLQSPWSCSALNQLWGPHVVAVPCLMPQPCRIPLLPLVGRQAPTQPSKLTSSAKPLPRPPVRPGPRLSPHLCIPRRRSRRLSICAESLPFPPSQGLGVGAVYTGGGNRNWMRRQNESSSGHMDFAALGGRPGGMPHNYTERGLTLRKRSEPVAWIQDSWRSGCGPCHVRG